MNHEQARSWLNKWVEIVYGTKHHQTKKEGILFTRDPETSHYLILEHQKDKNIWLPVFITGQSVQSVTLLEPQRDEFPPGIETTHDVDAFLISRPQVANETPIDDELLQQRKKTIKDALTKQRISFQEQSDGRIIALSCVSIWPPYRESDCTATSANAAAALGKISALLAKMHQNEAASQ